MNLPYGEPSLLEQAFSLTPVGMLYDYLYPDDITADDISFAPTPGGSSEPLVVNPSGNLVVDPSGKKGLPSWVGPTVFGVSLLVLVGVFMSRGPSRRSRK